MTAVMLGARGIDRELRRGRSEAARTAGGITFGVEEEFVLLDPSSGAAALAAPEVVQMLDGEPGVQQELMRFQVETASGVCIDLDTVGRQLVRLRRLVAEAAACLGYRLVATGILPYGAPGLVALTNQPRYRELARRYGALVADAGTCACHVHVGVPTRELGVQVLARIRPWLAPLLAISVNSPIAGGRDTGWASRRYPVWSRWPTATAPAVWPNAAAYDQTVRRFVQRGAALDQRSVYVLARLSPRYPTVEVRVADVCLDIGGAMLLAGLTRALVSTALAEARRGKPVPAVPTRSVEMGLVAAARNGLAGRGVDAFTGRTVAARDILAQLVDHVHVAIQRRGDTDLVAALLRDLDDRGTGAVRQQALFARTGRAPGFVEALARETTSDGRVQGRRPPRHGQGIRTQSSGSFARSPRRRPAGRVEA